MSTQKLLVDFENVQQLDLSKVDSHTHVTIFVGNGQKSVPIELVTSTQQLGHRAEWRRVEGSGKNALDFHIACELGRIAESAPTTRCIVLSKDKGFDPLLKHLNHIGMHCRRINSLIELSPGQAKSIESPNLKRVIDLLSKSEKKSRPRKRKTLAPHIASMFQKKLSEADINQLIDLLFAEKLITESNGTLTYEF